MWYHFIFLPISKKWDVSIQFFTRFQGHFHYIRLIVYLNMKGLQIMRQYPKNWTPQMRFSHVHQGEWPIISHSHAFDPLHWLLPPKSLTWCKVTTPLKHWALFLQSSTKEYFTLSLHQLSNYNSACYYLELHNSIAI